MARPTGSAALILLVACSPVDADGDGVLSSEDCDDTDNTIAPGLIDHCDDPRDEDCSGEPLPCRRMGPQGTPAWTFTLSGGPSSFGASLAASPGNTLPLAIGAPDHNDTGAIVQIEDPRPGASALEPWVLGEQAGSQLGAALGWAPSGALVAGAPGTGALPEDPAVPPIPAGAVYVIPALAAPGQMLSTVATTRWDGPSGSCFGTALSAGELLLVGAPCAASSYREHPSLPTPMLVDGLGVAIALPWAEGGGPAEEHAVVRVDGQEPWDQLGSAVLAGHDFDGDGASDMVIAAPDHHGTDWINLNGQGRVHVIDAGGESIATLDGGCCGTGRFDALGTALAAADVDGDAQSDLLSTVPLMESVDQHGGAWIDRGPIESGGAFQAEHSLAGPMQEGLLAQSGRSAVILDFDCDGVLDVALGAPSWGVADRPDQGAVHLWYGPLDPWTPVAADQWVRRGSGRDERLGTALAAVDLDADGCEDLVIGAPGPGPQGEDSGRVEVFAGGR